MANSLSRYTTFSTDSVALSDVELWEAKAGGVSEVAVQTVAAPEVTTVTGWVAGVTRFESQDRGVDVGGDN